MDWIEYHLGSKAQPRYHEIADYSSLRASIGSTAAARRAGITAAKEPTTINRTPASTGLGIQMLGSLEEGLAGMPISHRALDGWQSVKTFRGEMLNQNSWGNLLSAAASHAQIKALCVPAQRLGTQEFFHVTSSYCRVLLCGPSCVIHVWLSGDWWWQRIKCVAYSHTCAGRKFELDQSHYPFHAGKPFL
jgi:hypothetical protein